MVRQARSEATRKRIINAAVDLFAEVGYQATGLGDIIERARPSRRFEASVSRPRPHWRT